MQRNLKVAIFLLMTISAFKTMQRRKELWKEVKRLRSESQITFLNYRSIVVKGRRDSGD